MRRRRRQVRGNSFNLLLFFFSFSEFSSSLPLKTFPETRVFFLSSSFGEASSLGSSCSLISLIKKKWIPASEQHLLTILDLANSGADGDSPIDSTDSNLGAPAHNMDRDADSDAARKARLSD